MFAKMKDAALSKSAKTAVNAWTLRAERSGGKTLPEGVRHSHIACLDQQCRGELFGGESVRNTAAVRTDVEASCI